MDRLSLQDQMRCSSYIICGTPRSGSTLLCDLLASTGLAGRPHSYYRQQDVAAWADDWGVSAAAVDGDPTFESAYLAAVRRAGTNEIGVFGLRLMWGSVDDVARRLRIVFQRHGDDVAALLERAFGPILYIHLSRMDTVAQAVSLLRAEQTGLWHRHADGSERERTATPRHATYDADRLGTLRTELEADDAAWSTFFATRGLTPLRVTYEALSAEPKRTVSNILSALGRDADAADTAHIRTARMADSTSLNWADRFRSGD